MRIRENSLAPAVCSNALRSEAGPRVFDEAGLEVDGVAVLFLHATGQAMKVLLREDGSVGSFVGSISDLVVVVVAYIDERVVISDSVNAAKRTRYAWTGLGV